MSYVPGQAVWAKCEPSSEWEPAHIVEEVPGSACLFGTSVIYEIRFESGRKPPAPCIGWGACKCFLRPRDPMERNKGCWSDCAFQPKALQRA